jgi:hypothetical protein
MFLFLLATTDEENRVQNDYSKSVLFKIPHAVRYVYLGLLSHWHELPVGFIHAPDYGKSLNFCVDSVATFVQVYFFL